LSASFRERYGLGPAGIVLVGLVACSDRVGTTEDAGAAVTVPPTTVEPSKASCRPRPSGKVLAEFSAGDCGAALLEDDRGVGLWSLATDGEAEPARGPLPEPCAKGDCTFLGYDSAIGPVVLAMTGGPRSEMPTGVWLAAALDEAKQQLVFFDLWAGAGQSVVGDGTDLGPAHSLAPYSCAGKLGLFSDGRLAAAAGVEPAALLVAREGVYTWGSTEPQRADAQREACVRLAIELP